MSLIKILATIFMTMQGLWMIGLKMVEPRFQPNKVEVILLVLGFIVVFVAIWI